MLKSTTALRKIAGLKKRIKVVRGGQGAGKTISILILLVNHASGVADREILIISSELTKMRLTVIKDFIKVMKLAGIYNENSFLAGTLYRFPNGSFIKFIGLDKSDVGKGLRSDVAYFNEVNKCDFESYRQVASRAKLVFADYNPDAQFFIDTDVITRDDCDFIQLTFEDNELLDKDEREEILRYQTKGYNEDGTIKNSYWANLWQVYGLGNIGSLDGVVFSNWQQCDCIPDGAEFIAYGLDWGFTNDPTALVACYKFDGFLYFNELLYKTHLTNSDIVNYLKSLGVRPDQVIVADSAEPKSIQDLCNAGFWCESALKGPDSIKAGIDRLQQYQMLITSTSTNMIRELQQYTWAKDNNGKSLNAPIDAQNHCVDPARYIALNRLSQYDNQGVYSFSGEADEYYED